MGKAQFSYRLEKLRHRNFVEELKEIRERTNYSGENYEALPTRDSEIDGNIIGAEDTGEVARNIYRNVKDGRLNPDEAGIVLADILERACGSGR